jgi:uroporphyrin-III C-methyltransferase
MNGKVFLIGAGPGDPELLTLKALKRLQSADVVLHDELIGREILALVKPSAHVRSVGKRCGRQGITQNEINSLLIAFASFGVNVARLKGGDPSIFGRSGEETAALRLAGIEFEIVPGVTSALASAAAAQVSLTHRDQAHAVLLISNHLAKSGTLPWRSYVESGATLVIYMPGFDYEQIAGRLQGAGMRAETPCAVVSRVSTPEQQILRTTLNRLPRSSRLPAPTLLVVGEVLRNVEVEAGAGRYAWSTTGPGLSTEISALLASAQTQPLRGDQEHEL